MGVLPVRQVEPFEPLVSLYENQGLTLPRLGTLPADEMPQPYRRLLVHAEAMTPTLEEFFGQRLGLRVLDSHVSATTVRRQVVLAGTRDERPVEFGAIRIDLSCFDEQPRELLRQGRVPLGRLLGDVKIAFVCQPLLFFRVGADRIMRWSLGMEAAGQDLYGRCNRILSLDGRVMADVVEILAPVREARHGQTSVAV